MLELDDVGLHEKGDTLIMSDGMLLLTLAGSIVGLAAVVAVTRSFFARKHDDKRPHVV